MMCVGTGFAHQRGGDAPLGTCALPPAPNLPGPSEGVICPSIVDVAWLPRVLRWIPRLDNVKVSLPRDALSAFHHFFRLFSQTEVVVASLSERVTSHPVLVAGWIA